MPEDPFKKYGGQEIKDQQEDPFKKYGGQAIVEPVKKKEPSDVPSTVGSIGGQLLSEAQSQSVKKSVIDYINQNLPTEVKTAPTTGISAVKPIKSNPFTQTKEEAISHASNKLNEIMYGEGEGWQDPLKAATIGAQKSETTNDALSHLGAKNLTEMSLAPDGYEAKKTLAGTILGQMNDDNMTSVMLRQKANKYDNAIQDLKSIPQQLNQPNANAEFYDYNTTPLIESAAIKWRAKNDKSFADELRIKGVNPDDPNTLDEFKLGQTLNAYLQNPDIQTYFNKENHSLLNAAKRASETLLTKNREYGRNVVANEVSQAVQKAGYNNIDPILNYYGDNHKQYADLVAKDLYRDNPEKLQLWNSIKDNQEDYMDAPSFFQKFSEVGGQTLKGIPKTLAAIHDPYQSSVTTSKDIQDRWDKEAKNVSANPEGLSKYISETGGLAGLISSVAATGNLTGIANPATANMVATGLDFFGNELDAGKEKYPNNPLLAFMSGAGNTAMYMALSSDLFPGEKAKAAFQNVKPEVSKVMEQLTSGAITREAARKEMNTLAKKAIDFAGGTLTKSAKASLEMTGMGAVNRMLDGVFMDNENFQKFHPDDELVKTLSNTFLSFLPVSGLGKIGEMKQKSQLAKESYYAMAEKPKYFANVIDELSAKDPSINKDELLSNLQFLALQKVDLDAQKIPISKQKKIIYNELLKKVAKENAPKSPESTLLRLHDEKIRGLDKENEKILNEKPTIESAIITVGSKTYEGKNHAEAILKAKEDGQDISSVDRQGEGKFKLSDGSIIDREEAQKMFGHDKAELLIKQDNAAKKADNEYEKIKQGITEVQPDEISKPIELDPNLPEGYVAPEIPKQDFEVNLPENTTQEQPQDNISPEPDSGKTTTGGEQLPPQPPANEPPTTAPTLPEGEDNNVGVSHASLTKLAERLGLKKPETGDVLLPGEYADRGRKLLEAGADPNEVDNPASGDLVDRISVARAHLEDLVKQADAIGREKGIDSKEYKEAAQKVNDYSNNKVKPLGTKAGEAMRSLQGERDLDTGSFTEVKNAVEKDSGKPITEKQSEKIEELTKQNEELKKRAEEAEAKLIEETDKNIGKEQDPKTFKEKAKKAADKFRKLKSKPMTFKDENGNEHTVKMSGIGWNELVELGAKAIEATGEIADGVKAVLEKIADSDFYKGLSNNDKDRFAKQLESDFIDSLSNTPEAKNIRRLEKELENLRNGIVKQEKTERELSEKEKNLQEQIFEAKKNLGLIPSKGVKEQKVTKTEEEKKIEILEKQLDDLRNGVVKDKKEKSEDSQEVKDLKEKIFEAKKNLGLIASRSMPKNPSEKLTPEERSIKAKEKQLEDLRQGIVKQANEKRELSNREKELNDQIFEEKKKLGLVKSKSVDDTNYGLKITETEKKIKKLEKEKADLENGIIKQKEINSEKPSPAQQEKIDQLKDDIFNLKKDLGIFKSKEGKPLTEEEQRALDEAGLEKLQQRFVGKKDNNFSMQDSKDIWDYAKKTYLDNGIPWRQMIAAVRDDLGISWMQVNSAITTPKTERISDEMWKKQSDYSRNRNATKNWIENQNKGGVLNAIKKVSDKVRGVAVFGHGGIFVGTHAGMTFFSPSTFKNTFKAFLNGWRFAYGNKAKYERAMEELKNRPNYLIAQRAGLKNNPDRVNVEEFQKSQGFLGKLGGAGEHGFNAIKILRQELFDYHYNKLSEEEKSDKESVENVAKLINNATGATNLAIRPVVNEISFAGGMEAARWGKLTRNPAKATKIAIKALLKPNEVPIADRVFAKIWARRVGEQLATYTSILAANAAMQSLSGSKNGVNFTDPSKSDWLKMKVGNTNIDMTSGMLSTLNFLSSLINTTTASQKELGSDTRFKTYAKQFFGYGRGKLAPFYSTVIDLASQSDFSGNTMPFSNDKPPAGKHKLSWGEYLWNKAPIPVAEAARIAYESAQEKGMGSVQINDVLKGLAFGAFSGGTGFRVSEKHEKPTPYNEEDAKDPTFKYFLDKGLELPNTSHESEDITNKKTLEKKKLSEYPKEVQDNYDQVHKQELKSELDDLMKKGYVFIKKYSNGEFDVSEHRTPYSKRVNIDDLTKEELPSILKLAQSKATVNTKKKLFK